MAAGPAGMVSRLLLACVVAVGFVGSWATVRHQQQATLILEQDLPPDVQAEVDRTWTRFLDVFGSRRRCFDDVSLELVSDLPAGDARYLVGEARIEIRIPTSPSRFRESFVHELAHHVEHTCGDFAQLRRDFAALTGSSVADGDDRSRWLARELPWEQRPSEQWAETAVYVVNGRRIRHERTMPLPAGAPELVAGWAAEG